MQHNFQSQKPRLFALKRASTILGDIACLLNISADDKMHMIERREKYIKDNIIRNCLLNNSENLGTLLDDVAELIQNDDILQYRRIWSKFILNGVDEELDILKTVISDTYKAIKPEFSELQDLEYDGTWLQFLRVCRDASWHS